MADILSFDLRREPTPTREPFMVFPTLTRVYTWRVVARETNRTISRHRDLGLAIRKAEALNRLQNRPEVQ